MVGVDAYDEQDVSRLFELLRSHRRRIALHYLRDEDRPVDVQDLAAVIEDWERTTGDGDTSMTRIEIELEHWHLPKLADGSAIDYDERTGIARFNGSGLLESWLDETEPIDRP